MNHVLTVESEVPFGQLLHVHFALNNLQVDKAAPHGRIERHYLAWETVRKQRNPFFIEGTGFEGYLIGKCPNAESALDEILNINQSILDAIARLYHNQYGFQSRLMKTLRKEKSDAQAIDIWSAYFGAELGKLRVQMLQNKEALSFRKQTYEIIKSLPSIDYHETPDDIYQQYVIGDDNLPQNSKLLVTVNLLKPSQQDAWLVAENIGEFGHPLLRSVVEHY